ncbi:serine/threonine-protein kinase [uncultured Gimesia sp.]|uniref:serine/threonine protein kinase n=1 Tax=uncultured Gimesia sp. TaxID=1678688 RepID=UPI0026116FDD|nr:serine/threonine-protein kinase [uncultured Gimesia sp.]
MNFLKRFFSKESQTPHVNIKQRFELIGRVGQGSMSKVWRANDYVSGKMVALKVLHKQKTLELESRFIGLNKPIEGEIAIQLNHPNIVKTLEHGTTTENEQFLVMEFVEGYSLSFLVESQNQDMRANCLNYIIQLGEAIQYFHEENWIHRDICPRNIIVNNEHELKLIDFGLVVPNTAPFQQPGNRTGTAAYMAPELIKRQKTSQKIDIFSYSVTCYEMLTKRLPWDAAETLDAVLQHINTPPEDIQNFLPDINTQLAETIMRGLELYPQDRWQTMADMLQPLKEAFHTEQQKKEALPEKIVKPPASPQTTSTHKTSQTKRKKTRSEKNPQHKKQPQKPGKSTKNQDTYRLQPDQTSPELKSSTDSTSQEKPPLEKPPQETPSKTDHLIKKKPSSKNNPKNSDESP